MQPRLNRFGRLSMQRLSVEQGVRVHLPPATLHVSCEEQDECKQYLTENVLDENEIQVNRDK